MDPIRVCVYVYIIWTHCVSVCVLVCVCVDSPISGSAVRSAVTKLEGKRPTPWYVSPFHQLGSLWLNKKANQKEKPSVPLGVFVVLEQRIRDLI